jgi:hypothetical protein
MGRSLTLGIFATRIMDIAWIQALIVDASFVVRTVWVNFTFSLENCKIGIARSFLPLL